MRTIVSSLTSQATDSKRLSGPANSGQGFVMVYNAHCRYNSVEARWCSGKRVKLLLGGSVVHGQVGLFIALLFPKTRNFAPHCLSSPRCINGYRQYTAGCNPAMA